MGFFDKLKEGASKAADKAKDSVEVIRLHAQISSKRGEIEKLYAQIGKAVYQAHTTGQSASALELVQTASHTINVIQLEIVQLENKIKIIKAEKDCVCGEVLPFEAKYCSTCGHKFEHTLAESAPEVIIVNAAESGEVMALEETGKADTLIGDEEAVAAAASETCPSCKAALGADRICENCGASVL